MNEGPPHPARWRSLFRADWTRFVFVHYSIPADELAPFTPLELDCRDGSAFVSLVLFRLDGMRPARFLPASLGRTLFRPASNNWFLNVRTYVRGAAGPGIQFLIEWMDNPISLHLGPLLYGLPYRPGKFDWLPEKREGWARMRVTDARMKDALQISIRAGINEGKAARPKSLDEFLLEKFTAYTHHRGVSRFFKIAHPPWRVAQPASLEVDDTLIRRSCPWFANAERVCAHTSGGFHDVAMGFPHRLPNRTQADDPITTRRPAHPIP
jgi:hypothetical protein